VLAIERTDRTIQRRNSEFPLLMSGARRSGVDIVNGDFLDRNLFLCQQTNRRSVSPSHHTTNGGVCVGARAMECENVLKVERKEKQ